MKRIVVVLAVLAGLYPLVPISAKADGISIEAVAFNVTNKNDSLVTCDADGKSYTLRGFLVAPRFVLRDQRRAVTILIHGSQMDAGLWRLRPGGDSSFDFAFQLARLGHASLSVDLLGYGSGVTNDGPDGTQVCLGSQADIVHQLVTGARTGAYDWSGKSRGPAFNRVALAAISYGVQIAQPAAYSFGDIDALIVMGHALPPVPSADVTVGLALWSAKCKPPGETKYPNGKGPTGYHLFPADRSVPAMFNDPDPRVEAEWVRRMESDPCGQGYSTPAQIVSDAQHLGEITVPVLLAFGDHDEAYGQPAPQIHFQRFTGSADRTLMLFPGAGHVFFLERNRAEWTAMIAGWLAGHDL